MTSIVQSNIRFKVYGDNEPRLVVLHHTAGGRIGSEGYLKQKGLGYHAMIDRDGTVHMYNPPDEIVGHALKANHGTVGISFVAGTPLGPVTDEQIQAAIDLINHYKDSYDTLTEVSDHATVDIVIAGRGQKSDPQYQGEKPLNNDFNIKYKVLDHVASKTGLKALKK